MRAEKNPTVRSLRSREFCCLRRAGVVVVALALVGCDGDSPKGQSCLPGQVWEDGECVDPPEPDIAVNSVGFTPEAPKRATARRAGDEFTLRRVDDDEVVFTGPLVGPTASEDTGEEVWTIEFSEVTEPGEYYLRVRGLETSAPFRIGDDALDSALSAAMLGLYGQRCGTAVSFTFNGTDYSHGACHLHDAELVEPHDGVESKDMVGGWHDAGDYGKYTINGAFSVGYMLKAWEHFPANLAEREFEVPERGGAFPDFLDEAKWQIDWLRTMQFDDGSVSDIADTLSHPPMNLMPEDDQGTRFAGPTGTQDAAAVAAVLAQAARIYEPFDAEFAQECLDAAWLSYDHFSASDSDTRANLGDSGFNVGDYSWGHGYREWALAELWESTGDADVLAAIEGRLFDADDGDVARALPRNWDWADARALGIYTYVLSEREGRTQEILDAVTADLLAVADELESAATEHGYGRALPTMYYWGSNGVLLRTGMTLEVAYRLTGEERYRTAELSQLDFILGRNYFARSFVTRVGNEPPRSPHHRPSLSDRAGTPWPGLLIGGPNDQQDTYDYDGRAWVDLSDNYFTNEVAINWNAALIYALAGWPSAAPVVEE